MKHKLFSYINLFLRIFLSIVFCYSAISKLNSIDTFELTIVELSSLAYSYSYYISRGIIGLEFILGLYLLLGWELKSKTLPIILILLSSFSFFMIYIYYKGLDVENCGCFGDKILITPLETVVKNLFMILGVLYLLFTNSIYKFKLDRYNGLLYWLILFSFWMILFYTHPISKNIIKNNSEKIALNLKFIQEKNKELNINKGKWLIGVISLDCKYCKIAIRKLVQFKKLNPKMPIYIVMYGEEKQAKEFVEKYNMQDLAYSYTNDFNLILDLIIAPNIPVFFMVEDGYLVQKRTNNQLDFEELNLWK